MPFPPLKRDEVIGVIEGRGAAQRVPVMIHLWVHPDAFGERRGQVEALLAKYPQDFQLIGVRIPGIYDAPADDPEYRWVNFGPPAVEETNAIDAQAPIRDWSLLDGVLRDFPNPRYPGAIPASPPPDGRYRAAHWWFCLFERHWSLRGMTNALMDYHIHPRQVHRLFRALTDFYLVFRQL